MEVTEGKTTYFEKGGPDNTEEAFRIAKRRAEERGIKTILIASTRGETAVKAVEFFKGMRVIAVSHQAGWREPDTQEFTPEYRQKVEKMGGVVLTTAHTFSGIDRAMRTKFNMRLLGDTIASTLRIFGEGMKVVCEIAMMAADAGLVRTDEDAVVIGGTNKGADTVVVLKPVNSSNFFSFKIQEILCKPHFAVAPQKQEATAAAEHHH